MRGSDRPRPGGLLTVDPQSPRALAIVNTVTNVPLAALFYELFKVVNRRLALLDASLSYLSTPQSAVGYDIHTVFFGCDAICTACLILRSTFISRAIGVLMAIDGVAYLVYSFADILAPGFASYLVPRIQLPALVCEGSFCL